MKFEHIKKCFFYLFFIIGIILVIFSFSAAIFSNFGAVNLIMIFMGIVFISFRYLPENKFSKIYIGLSVFATLVYSLIFIFLTLYIPDTAVGNEDAVIVLGCSVKGDKPSNFLMARTNAAYEYYKINPSAVFVLSGGKGSQENISEAEAMKRLLLDSGIPEDRLLLEDKATTTKENFRYSKLILDKYFDNKPYSAVYITNTFHCYRSLKIAEISGYDNIKCYPAETPSVGMFLNYYREAFAVIKFWIFDYTR
ncbi:MAG: YdcF family protein [Firmicutes bacterium]|nr:YdcF family protein [Bacillota bacterium]